MPDTTRAVNREAAAPEAPPRSPYVGLSFYTAENADFFFGRETERQVVMGNLRASRLTLLHADSGVGKSSLLRAGVAARLQEIARSKFANGDPIDVPVVFSSWRDDPIDELIGEIERTVNSYIAESAVELPRGSLTGAITEAVKALDLAAAANRAATRPRNRAEPDEDDRPSSTLLIILDQFEEYFLYGSREMRGGLADELAAAISNSDLGANFLISIREDSFAALGNLLRGRISNVYGNDLYLDYLDSKSAREAVEYPVDRYNHLHPDRWVEIEDGLVDALLSEVRREQNGDRAGAGSDGQLSAGALAADAGEHDGQVVTPYLQLVMTKLWDHDHRSGELRLRTLEELHGAKQIVADHLDDALSSLQPKDRETAIEALHHLVTPGGTKIALEVGDLAAYIRRPVDEVEPVLETLAGDARILRTVPTAPGKSRDDPANQRFEIYHDVLAGPINRAVSASAVEHERSRAARARRFAGGALVLALGAVIAAIIAVFALEDASTQKHAAQSGQLAASAESELSANPELATLLALRAWQIHHTALAEKALRHALPQLQLQRTIQAKPPVTSVAYSPEGSLVAVASSDGIASLWDTSTDKRVGTLGVPGLKALNNVAFSRDGSKLATAYGDGTARIWEVKTRRQLGAPLTEPGQGALYSAAFSPDGKELVTAGNAGYARIWDVGTHSSLKALRFSDGNPVSGAAFSPNGKLIVASGTYHDLAVWSAKPPYQQLATGFYNAPLYSAAFNPAGTEVLTASGDGHVETWSATSLNKPLRTLSDADYEQISIVPNAVWAGSEIVASGLNSKAHIWNASSGRTTPIRALRAGGISILAVATNAKGDRVITAGADGAARIWDPRSGKQLAVLRTSGQDPVQGAAFSPDGRFIGTASYGGNVSLWDATTGKPRLRLTLPHRAGANGIRIPLLSEGDLLAVAGGDGFGYIFNAKTGTLLSEISPKSPSSSLAVVDFSNAANEWMTAGQENGNAVVRFWRYRGGWKEVGNPNGLVVPYATIYDAAFSPDGKRVVTATNDGKARIWSSSGKDSKPLATISEPFSAHAQSETLRSAEFSPDGKLILTGSEDGTARAWDAVGRRHPLVGTITDPQGEALQRAAFSADRRWMATASLDGTARVWDLASGRPLLTLAGHSSAINTIAFSPDGTRLVTASADGTTKLWAALPAQEQGLPIENASHADTNTVAFSPDGRVIATANSDGYTRLWTAATGQHRLLASLPGAPVASAEFSSDGRWLVTGDYYGNGELWDASKHKPLAQLVDPDMYMSSLASAEISPDGKLIATAGTTFGGNDGVGLWSVRQSSGGTGVSVRLLRRLPAGSSLRWAAFSPDGKLIVTSDDQGVAKIWNLATGEQVGATLTEPGHEAVSDAWFSPSLPRSAPQWLRQEVQSSSLRVGPGTERYLVITSSDDGTARVWNIRTGAQLAAFTEPDRSSIYNAVFSPSGQFVLTASQDGTARIWSLGTGAQMTEFNTGDPMSDAEFSPAGDRIATADQYGTTRVFWARLDEPMAQLVATAQRELTSKLTAAELRQFGG